MPLDKRDQQDKNTLTLAKVMWWIAAAIVLILCMAFLAGIAVHYVVEFFEKGWSVVAASEAHSPRPR